MPLDKQNVPIAFGQGIDTKNDPKQLMPGKLTTLQNGVFQTGNELKKRNGYQALTKSISSGGTIGAGVLVSDYNNELIELDGSSLYSYNAGGTTWINKGSLVTTTLQTSTVVRNTTQQTLQDSAINGNYRCFVWYDSLGQIGYSVYDTETGQSIVNNQTVDVLGLKAKVLSLGSNFVIIYYDGTGHKLRYKSISTTTPTTISAAVDIATDIDQTDYAFDASVYNSRIYIAYGMTSANHIGMYYLDSSLVLSSKLDVTGSATPRSICVLGDASFNSWVGYSPATVGGRVYCFIANPNLSSVTVASTQVDAPSGAGAQNITGLVSGTTATFYYQVAQTSSFVSAQLTPPRIITNTFVKSGTTGSAGTATVFIRGMGLASKAFSYSSTTYMLISFQSTLQNSYFLINGLAQIVAKLSPSLGGGYTTLPILPEMNAVSTGVYQTASLIKDFLSSTGGDVFTQTGVISAKFTFSLAAPSKFTLGNNLHIAGGQLNMYDGGSVVEHGFALYPEGATTTIAQNTSGGSGGVGVASSTQSINQLQYSATYEWTDNQGQVHQSAPSIPVTLQVPAGQVFRFTATVATGSASLTAVSSTAGLCVGMFVQCLASVNSGPPWFASYWTYNTTITAVVSGTVTVNDAAGTVAGSPVTLVSFMASSAPVTLMRAPYAINTDTPSAFVTTGAAAKAGQIVRSASLVTDAVFTDPTYLLNATSGQTSTKAIVDTVAPFLFYSMDTNTITATIPTLKATAKSRVSIVLYRTEVNGTVFYRVNSPTSPTYNDKTVDSVTITDNVPDKTLIGNEQLYTTGEIENIEAPAITIGTTFKSRAVVVQAENELSWAYSKKVVPGAPVSFSDFFVSNLDQRIKACKAVGVLDEKIIFFGPTNKFFVVGDGPSASGANNDFSEPQYITGSTGCSNQASLLSLPIGLMYQDPSKGIYLLDRSLQEQYIGQDVEAYNSDPITSAQLIEGTTSARLTLTSGTVLIYDWFYNQWGADPYSSEVISSTIFEDEFTYVQSNGLVLKETAGAFTDNASYFSLAPTTGWLSFAGVEGFQRVYELLILGTYKSPHTLNVNIYTDFNDTTPAQTVAIPVTSDPAPYNFRIRLNKQKCTAVKIAISDSNQSGTGESYSLSNMAFRVGVKKGLNKLSAAKSY